MTPSLFTSTILFGIVFLLLSAPFLLNWKSRIKAFPRSVIASYVTLGISGVWFLWKILNLSQSDFGDYKNILFGIFAVTLVGSFLWVKDFLAVRGAAALILLSANAALKSAFGLYDIPERLVLVTVLYVLILIALYLGTIPFKLRDFFDWLLEKSVRMKMLGIVLAATGLVLLGTAFTY